jgi:hypothetical protein
MKQTLLIMGLFSAFLSCKVKKEINNIYPYIITDAYPKEQTLFVDTLGHGLYVTLVYDEKGLVRNVTPKELEESGMTITQLKDSAISNLAKAVKSQQVTTVLYITNDSIPFALFTDSWLSASCILLPDLKEKLSQHLGSESLFVCIPNRDAMLVFPKLTEEQKLNTQQFVKEKESGATKPLSFDFFKIIDHKIVAVK